MLEPRRIISNIAPSIIENLGNGNWYYNYDIKSEKVELPIQEGETVPKEKSDITIFRLSCEGSLSIKSV